MANGLPWFPFYPAEFLLATGGWPPERVGAYMRLLCYQWDHGGLPNNEEELRAMSGMAGYSEYTWSNTHSILRTKFEQGSDGLLRNKKLESIRQEQVEKREFNVARGRRAVKLRWERKRQRDDTLSIVGEYSENTKVSPLENPPSPTPSHPSPPSREPTCAGVILPEGLNLDAWNDWIAYRREARLKAWVASTVKIKSKWLAKKSIQEQRAVIEQSISNGYQGLFEIGGKPGAGKKLTARERIAAATGDPGL